MQSLYSLSKFTCFITVYIPVGLSTHVQVYLRTIKSRSRRAGMLSIEGERSCPHLFTHSIGLKRKQRCLSGTYRQPLVLRHIIHRTACDCYSVLPFLSQFQTLIAVLLPIPLCSPLFRCFRRSLLVFTLSPPALHAERRAIKHQ